MKIRYINAIKWSFGFNNKEANLYYKNTKNNIELLNAILNSYENNAKKNFYND